MQIDQNQYDNAIARIRVSFAATLKGHLESLTLLNAKIAAPDERPDALVGISDIAHKIHGVAKTLQYDELGRIAADVEQALAPTPMSDLREVQLELARAQISDLLSCIADICAMSDQP